MKDVAWPRRHHRTRVGTAPSAPAVITSIAKAMEDRSSIVLGRAVTAAVDPVVRIEKPPSREPDIRAWRCTGADAVLVWLIVDERSACALLGIVLGSAVTACSTALERTIVEETVQRLCATTEMGWNREDDLERLPDRGGWSCSLQIAGAARLNASLTFSAHDNAPEPTPQSPAMECARIPIHVGAFIDGVPVPLGAVSAWRAGDMVALQSQSEPYDVGLSAGGFRFATGRLGASAGRRAVCIDRIGPPA